MSAELSGLVLAVDTSADVAGVAVANSAGVIASGCRPAVGRQVEELAPLIQRVMAEASADFSLISQVVCAVGPGPYTSLRVGVMTAQVLAAAIGAKAYGVCTHDVLASQFSADHAVVVITQARRREPAFSVYVGDERVEGPAIAPLEEILAKRPGAQVVTTIDIGVSDTAVCDTAVNDMAVRRISPDPAGLAQYFLSPAQGRVVRGAGLLEPVPIYLRPADVREPIDLRGKALRAAINQ
jgi:tRNA threonylcarbamoyl adenosine modification protein YeaZ